MLSKFNGILTVTQKVSSQKVNTNALRMEGIELMTHLRSSFLDERGNPWVQIIPSVHQMCAHAWQLFEMNKGRGVYSFLIPPPGGGEFFQEVGEAFQEGRKRAKKGEEKRSGNEKKEKGGEGEKRKGRKNERGGRREENRK